MRILTTIEALLALSVSAFAQVAAIPTFTVTSNDVAQSSITVFHMKGTNEAKVSVKFAFSDTGAKRLEEFYRAHSVGQEVRYQIGTFELVFRLDDRKHFGREGFWGLPERDAKALEAGLKDKNEVEPPQAADPRVLPACMLRQWRGAAAAERSVPSHVTSENPKTKGIS